MPEQKPDSQLLRILDANFNRAREAIRVVEDYARFCLNSALWTSQLKEMRHELREIVNLLDPHELLKSRNTDWDVGVSLSGPSEYTRASSEGVAKTNLKRLQETLRTLEEYSKLVDPQVAARIERVRYRSYSIERGMLLRPAHAREKLSSALLYVIITQSVGRGRAPVDLARAAVAGGADIIQLREKQWADCDLLRCAQALRDITAEAGALFIINDRPDLAVLCHADGVHLGQQDLPVHQARLIVGDELIIGASTHSPEQALQAERDGADYIGVGPVYRTTTKPKAEPVGLDLAHFASEHVRLPSFAIGGITLEKIAELRQVGVRAISVCSAAIAAEDVSAATRALKQAMLSSQPTVHDHH